VPQRKSSSAVPGVLAALFALTLASCSAVPLESREASVTLEAEGATVLTDPAGPPTDPGTTSPAGQDDGAAAGNSPAAPAAGRATATPGRSARPAAGSPRPSGSASPRRSAGKATATVTAAPLDVDGAGLPQTVNGLPLKYSDDFTGPLSSAWSTYDGVPGGVPDGLWKSSHVFTQNGMLIVRGSKEGSTWVTGGLMNHTSAATTYGTYLVRYRMNKGVGIKYALLLWPSSNKWPDDGEIDFAEDAGGNRSNTGATLHFGSDNSLVQREVSANFSTWHTMGVTWQPGKLTLTLDGSPWGTISGAGVPTKPMNLAIQTEMISCTQHDAPCPGASTPANVDLEVDWVAVYGH